MQILSGLVDQFSVIGFYALSFTFVLTLIVFVHEYGHFKVARLCGVKVETFSIAFGREIVGFTDRFGTRWKIGWIPLGGFVKFQGDANAASMPVTPETDGVSEVDPGNFHTKPLWQRALVVAAGPFANFILAIAIFAAYFMAVGQPFMSAKIGQVLPESAAEIAGLQKGDLVVKLNGEDVLGFNDIQRIVMPRADETINITVSRDGREISGVITPKRGEISDGLGGKVPVGLIGISSEPGAAEFIKKGPVEALGLGVNETWQIVSGTFHYLGKMIVGKESAQHLGGPLAIAQISGKAASVGFGELLRFAAIISVSIGLINLFPIPLLDGGHLVYYAIEAVRGRPLGPKAQEMGFRVGFALVIALMIFSTFNDIIRISGF